MKFFISIFLVFFYCESFAALPSYWNSMLRLEDRHEFYKDNNVLSHPEDTWQLLFSVVYPSEDFLILKDCLFYYIPKKDNGILKVKTLSSMEKCEDFTYKEGSVLIQGIKSLQFSIKEKIKLIITLKNFEIINWETSSLNAKKNKLPKLFLSSAEFKMGKYILLSPKKNISNLISFKLKRKICHNISDNCEEVYPSECELCEEGWYEVPNGCPNSPKYCGLHVCGQKNRPACRRGLPSQDVHQKLDCLKDEQFFFCHHKLNVFCESGKFFCR